VESESWDSESDLNQGMNLIVELFERGVGSMRAVAVGTEGRDHNGVTHLERPLSCLDHVSVETESTSVVTVIWMRADDRES